MEFVYGIKDKMGIRKEGAFGDAQTSVLLNYERNGSKEIRVYIHIREIPYIEYSVSKLGRPKDSRIFTSFAAMESLLKASAGIEDDSKYIDKIYISNQIVLDAFLDAGWPADIMCFKKNKAQVHITVAPDIAKAIDNTLEELQLIYPKYTLSDLVNNSLAKYYKRDDLLIEHDTKRKIQIFLGNNTIFAKRNTTSGRMNMLDAYLYSENNTYYVELNLGIRIAENRQILSNNEQLELKEIRNRRFSTTEEIERVLENYVVKKDPEIIKEIKVRNNKLCQTLLQAGWTKITSPGKRKNTFQDMIDCYRKNHKSEWPGERVLLYMEGAAAPARAKVKYDGHIFFEYNAYGNIERFDDESSLFQAVYAKKGFEVVSMNTTNKFLYEKMMEEGFNIVLDEKKRAIHANINSELEKLLPSDKVYGDKTAVVETAIAQFLAG